MELRRQRFIEYFDRVWKPNGGRKAFMEATGFKKARVSQLFDIRQPFGELAGRKVAIALKLPPNYFEVKEGGFTKKALELARMYDAWPSEPAKDAWYAMATSFLESKAVREETDIAPALSAAPSPEPAHS